MALAGRTLKSKETLRGGAAWTRMLQALDYAFLGLTGLFLGAQFHWTAASAREGTPVPFELKSTAFKHGGDIPKKCTCEGPNVSPPLDWSEPPAGTQSFALITDDPDAPMGTWVHWVAYDLPAGARQLPEGVPQGDELQGGGRQGRNDFPEIGYGGPCPPPGKPHRYFFKLYALDKKLGLQSGATKQEVEGAMQGHTLGKAELMGKYKR
jgi:Raf kinase inhibitor-like YbhB/YbcL family protein